MSVANKFKSYGCSNIYIDESFVTKKKEPNDIDACFDVTEVNYQKLKTEHHEFFNSKGLNDVHIYLFDYTFSHSRSTTQILLIFLGLAGLEINVDS